MVDPATPLVKALQTLLSLGDFHVLLYGDTASGKTTLIDVAVREYYGSDEVAAHNVLRIHCLKDYGIQYFRTEVRGFCKTYSTVRGKKKMVVLDDVDFLNETCQQVFCRHIDEHKDRVFFVASCNNLQRVVDHLHSRLASFYVHTLTPDQVRSIARKVRDAENIAVDDQALEYVVSLAGPAVQVALHYLEQFQLVDRPVDHALAVQLCTHVHPADLDRYVDHVLHQRLRPAIEVLTSFVHLGYSVLDILNAVYHHILQTPLLAERQRYALLPYICKYVGVFYTTHEDEIELTLFTHNAMQALAASAPLT